VHVRTIVCVGVCMSGRESVYACMCACVHKKCVCVFERGCEGERVSVCVKERAGGKEGYNGSKL